MQSKRTEGHIDIFGSEDDAVRIHRVIEATFTKEEIEIMCRYGGVNVYVTEREDNAIGEYTWKRNGMPTPYIKITENVRDDTIVHEFVHHLRVVGDNRIGITRTPFPMNEEGEITYDDVFRKYVYDALNVEESATVAETTARIRSKGGLSGYFSRISGTIPILAYIHDRLLLTGSKNEETSKDLRGKKAVDAVNEMYFRTKISDAQIFPYETSGRAAKESWDLLKKIGLI
jgi:hypothetical protein